ncbi:MAG: hypothetical protein R3B13_17035 [Polyangiaceae bacterium]
MNTFAQLIDLIGPRPPASVPTRTERLYVAGTAFLASLAFAALWGVAAGSGGGHLALRNLASVPMLLTVSTLASLPVGVFALRLTCQDGSATNLVLAHTAAMFGGALVLALLSPLVTLYQLSSSWAGPPIAIASACLAFLCGIGILIRILRKLDVDKRSLALPVLLLVFVQLASLAQLSVLAPSVLPTRSLFGRGIDGISIQR